MRFTAILLAVSLLAMNMPVEAQSSWFAVVSPRDGETLSGRSAEVCVSYSTSPLEKITRIELCIDGRTWGVKYLPEPSARGLSSFIIDTSEFGNGAHSILAKFFSGAKLVGSAFSTCSIGNSFIDVIPPTVSFSGLKDNTVVKGIVGIKIDAKDNSGEDPMVSFYIDKSLKMIKNTPPYEYLWNTKEWEDGRHTLSACAFDKSGNKGDARDIIVIVDNGNAAITADIDRTRNSVDTAKPETAKSVTPPSLQPVKTTVDSTARSSEQPKVTHPVSSTALAPIDKSTDNIKPSGKTNPTSEIQLSETKITVPKTEPTVVIARAETKSATTPVGAIKSIPDAKWTAPTPNSIESQAKTFVVASAAIEAYEQELTNRIPTLREPDSPIPAPLHTMPNASVDTGDKLAVSEIGNIESPAVIKAPSAGTSGSITTNTKTTQNNIGSALAKKVIQTSTKPVVLAAAPKVQPAALPPALEPRKPNFVILKTNTFRRTIVTELRHAVSAAGGTIISWDNKTKTATAQLDGQTIIVHVGKNTAVIDGKPIKIQTAPYINKYGRTVVDIALIKTAAKDNIAIDPKTGQCKLIFD